MPYQPPSVASWLVDAFAPYPQAAIIAGDLLEEFSELAAKEGTVSARRWYWRQSVKTIFHFFPAAFRSAPWIMAGAILAGSLTGMGGWSRPATAGFDWLTYGPAVALLKRYPVYHYINANLFWTLYNPRLIHSITLSIFMGCIAGTVAKGRETIAAVSLSLLWGALATASCLWWPPLTVYQVRPSILHFLLQYVVTGSIAIAIGGMVIRKVRVGVKRRSVPAAG